MLNFFVIATIAYLAMFIGFLIYDSLVFKDNMSDVWLVFDSVMGVVTFLLFVGWGYVLLTFFEVI